MELIGLIDNIIEAAIIIDSGRKGFAIIGDIEKSLLKQRHSNLSTAQDSYTKKQKIALMEGSP